jgi:ribosomal protein S1
MATRLFPKLEAGEIRKGKVKNIVDFGAFVDLGGVDGLIHISELDWEYVEDPNDVLSVGDEVEVYVLNVDRERGRIALSRKRVIPLSHAE